MTIGTDNKGTSTCEDLIWGISTWVATKLDDNMVFELRESKEEDVATTAQKLYDTYGKTDAVLGSLLNALDSRHAQAETKRCVHLSALRGEVRTVIRAYRQFPSAPRETRIGAYRQHTQTIELAAQRDLASTTQARAGLSFSHAVPALG